MEGKALLLACLFNATTSPTPGDGRNIIRYDFRNRRELDAEETYLARGFGRDAWETLRVFIAIDEQEQTKLIGATELRAVITCAKQRIERDGITCPPDVVDLHGFTNADEWRDAVLDDLAAAAARCEFASRNRLLVCFVAEI